MKNRKRFIIIITVLALLAFLAVSIAPYISAIVNAAPRSAQELTRAKEKALADMEAAKQKKNEGLEGQRDTEKRIDALDKEIYSVRQNIWQNEYEISLKEAEIEEATKLIGEYDDEFKTRARAMYKRGNASYLDVLLGANNFADLMYKVEMVNRIINYDKDILQKMENAKQTIVSAKAEIEEQKAQNELNWEILEIKRDEQEIEVERWQKMIDSAGADEAEAERIYAAAEAELKSQLSSMISSGAASSYSGSTVPSYGTLQWPSASSRTVTSEYGTRFHPIQKVYKTHTGLDIGAAYGTNVLAAESGTVILAGWNGGYGYCVVIDHGNGLSTLYGHNSSLNVSVGTKVSRGQTIAFVGSTGNSTGPHIHFEVLINGRHTNPRSYVS